MEMGETGMRESGAEPGVTVQRLVAPMTDRTDTKDYRLTRQERRVLELLLQGHQKKTAAAAMGVSVNTISFHLKNAYGKLGVHSKTEAVVKGLLAGLIGPGDAPARLPVG